MFTSIICAGNSNVESRRRSTPSVAPAIDSSPTQTRYPKKDLEVRPYEDPYFAVRNSSDPGGDRRYSLLSQTDDPHSTYEVLIYCIPTFGAVARFTFLNNSVSIRLQRQESKYRPTFLPLTEPAALVGVAIYRLRAGKARQSIPIAAEHQTTCGRRRYGILLSIARLVP